MPFNFNTLIERKHTDCIKWDGHTEWGIPEDALPMWVADMDFELPEPIATAIMDRATHPIYGYTLKPKSYEEAICHWMRTRHDWELKEDWIVVTPNVVSALNIAIRAFTEIGDKVLIQEPVYNPFSRSILVNERVVAINELVCTDDRYTINFEDFEAKVSDPQVKLFILCNPHNPVGRVWAKEELVRMGELCLKHNVLVVVDEIHHDLVFKSFKHTSMGTLSSDIAHNLITCTATGKTFNVASVSHGNIIIQNPLIRNQFIKHLNQLGIDTLSPFAKVVVETGYTKCSDWVDALVDYIEGNKNYICQFIKEHLPQIKVIQSEGTYLLWLDMRSLNLDSDELMHFMSHKAKLWAHSGAIFGKSGEGYIRLNIATSRAHIELAMERLKASLYH